MPEDKGQLVACEVTEYRAIDPETGETVWVLTVDSDDLQGEDS